MGSGPRARHRMSAPVQRPDLHHLAAAAKSRLELGRMAGGAFSTENMLNIAQNPLFRKAKSGLSGLELDHVERQLIALGHLVEWTHAQLPPEHAIDEANMSEKRYIYIYTYVYIYRRESLSGRDQRRSASDRRAQSRVISCRVITQNGATARASAGPSLSRRVCLARYTRVRKRGGEDVQREERSFWHSPRTNSVMLRRMSRHM